MKIIDRLRDKWNEKTPKEKGKAIVSIVSDIGIDIVFAGIYRLICPKGETGIGKKIAVGTALTGMSLWAADRADEAFSDAIDDWDEAWRMNVNKEGI